LGVAAALATGAIMGLLMALISVTLKAEQGISGIGLYLLGLGMSSLLFKMLIGSVQSVQGFPTLQIPFLSTLPLLGPIFFDHNILTYIAYLCVPIAVFAINRTSFGLKVRAVGHNPEAADSLGVNVNRVRYATLTIGAAMAGLAGASLSIGLLNIFQENMTNGLGFIAVALVYFGGWRPVGVLLGALLFSTVNALQLWIQLLDLPIAPDLAVMLPYILTIVALALAMRQVRQPAALTKPYERDE
jgi:simple sugar transport system permease protein